MSTVTHCDRCGGMEDVTHEVLSGEARLFGLGDKRTYPHNVDLCRHCIKDMAAWFTASKGKGAKVK